jgi:hypothetical protein
MKKCGKRYTENERRHHRFPFFVFAPCDPYIGNIVGETFYAFVSVFFASASSFGLYPDVLCKSTTESYILFRKDKRVVVREGDMKIAKISRIFQVSEVNILTLFNCACILFGY